MKGGPALKPIRQRSDKPRSSGPSAPIPPKIERTGRSPGTSAPTLFAVCSADPSTLAGSCPFSGYMIKEVLTFSPMLAFSYQKVLYPPGSSPTGGACGSTTNSASAASSACRRSACRIRSCFTSSGVKNSWVPNRSGRCIGVLELKFHTPCKSGRPHSVRGT